jgi:hypothetical protein
MPKAERQHYDRLSQLGCIACLVAGYGYSPPEIHHARNGAGMGQKSHYLKAIPLCHAHHRTGGYGTALHAGQKAFEDRYGTESELLAKVESLLSL